MITFLYTFFKNFKNILKLQQLNQDKIKISHLSIFNWLIFFRSNTSKPIYYSFTKKEHNEFQKYINLELKSTIHLYLKKCVLKSTYIVKDNSYFSRFVYPLFRYYSTFYQIVILSFLIIIFFIIYHYNFEFLLDLEWIFQELTNEFLSESAKFKTNSDFKFNEMIYLFVPKTHPFFNVINEYWCNYTQPLCTILPPRLDYEIDFARGTDRWHDYDIFARPPFTRIIDVAHLNFVDLKNCLLNENAISQFYYLSFNLYAYDFYKFILLPSSSNSFWLSWGFFYLQLFMEFDYLKNFELNKFSKLLSIHNELSFHNYYKNLYVDVFNNKTNNYLNFQKRILPNNEKLFRFYTSYYNFKTYYINFNNFFYPRVGYDLKNFVNPLHISLKFFTPAVDFLGINTFMDMYSHDYKLDDIKLTNDEVKKEQSPFKRRGCWTGYETRNNFINNTVTHYFSEEGSKERERLNFSGDLRLSYLARSVTTTWEIVTPLLFDQWLWSVLFAPTLFHNPYPPGCSWYEYGLLTIVDDALPPVKKNYPSLNLNTDRGESSAFLTLAYHLDHNISPFRTKLVNEHPDVWRYSRLLYNGTTEYSDDTILDLPSGKKGGYFNYYHTLGHHIRWAGSLNAPTNDVGINNLGLGFDFSKYSIQGYKLPSHTMKLFFYKFSPTQLENILFEVPVFHVIHSIGKAYYFQEYPIDRLTAFPKHVDIGEDLNEFYHKNPYLPYRMYHKQHYLGLKKNPRLFLFHRYLDEWLFQDYNSFVLPSRKHRAAEEPLFSGALYKQYASTEAKNSTIPLVLYANKFILSYEDICVKKKWLFFLCEGGPKLNIKLYPRNLHFEKIFFYNISGGFNEPCLYDIYYYAQKLNLNLIFQKKNYLNYLKFLNYLNIDDEDSEIYWDYTNFPHTMPPYENQYQSDLYTEPFDTPADFVKDRYLDLSFSWSYHWRNNYVIAIHFKWTGYFDELLTIDKKPFIDSYYQLMSQYYPADNKDIYHSWYRYGAYMPDVKEPMTDGVMLRKTKQDNINVFTLK